MSFYKNVGKRFMDLAIATIVFVAISPLFFLLCLLLKICQGSIFFIQERPGLNEKIFKIIKFKTMTNAKDENGKLLPDKKRITKIGYLVRATSLDEIPQLINVIKGDMAIIGPRPLLPQYLPLYNDYQRRRHNVRPGITGWAQINGRNSISWEKKFEYDVYYVNHLSCLFDLKILFLTIKKVFLKDGVNQSEDTTMQPFSGK